MKTKLTSLVLSASLLVLAVVLATRPGTGAAPAAPAETGGTVVPNFKAVRAEYTDLSGNHYHVDTLCFLQNRSATTPLVLKEVFVLGPGGFVDVIGVHTGLVGTVIEPLGEYRFWIDDTIPGVAPQTSVSATGVRTVVFAWEGPHEALRLTARAERTRHSGGTSDFDRVHDRLEGFDVVL